MTYSMDAAQFRRVVFILVGMVATLAVQVAIFPLLHSLGFLAPFFFKSEQIVIKPAVVLCFVCHQPGPDHTAQYTFDGKSGNTIKSIHHHEYCDPPDPISPSAVQPIIPGVYEYRLTDEKRGMGFMLFFAAFYTLPFAFGYFLAVLQRIDFSISTSGGARPVLHEEMTRYAEHFADLVHQITVNSWRWIKRLSPSSQSASNGMSAGQHLSLSLTGFVALFTRTISCVRLTATNIFTNPSVWTRNVALGTFVILSYVIAVLTHHFV